MSTIQAIILAIVEGITEFLPISSTGHMIIASSLMHIASDEFVKLYEVAIQLGCNYFCYYFILEKIFSAQPLELLFQINCCCSACTYFRFFVR